MLWLFLHFLCVNFTLLAMNNDDFFEPVALHKEEEEHINALKNQMRESFEKNETPLHWNQAEINDIHEVMTRGLVQIDDRDEQGNTPLHKAIEHHDIEKALLFIDEYHANVIAENNEGQTPLHFAAKYNNIIMFLCLLGRCIDCRKQDKKKKNPFDYVKAGSLLARQFGFNNDSVLLSK